MLWRSEILIYLKIVAGVAFVSDVKYIRYLKDSEDSILVSARPSTVYAAWRIKSKTKQILVTVIPT